jgi:two-component system CheB/CheR fusion protein
MSEKFHIIGIAVSEGGQRGLLEFLQHLPSEPNMAFVVVHNTAYNLDQIIARVSGVQTAHVKHGARIKKNNLYIAPRDVFVSIEDGCFKLEEREDNDGVIDFFFTSLAHESGEYAVGVVLSGTGHDGLIGLADIDTYGGKILVQSRSTALMAPERLPTEALDAVHPTLVASPATLALYLTSFSLFSGFKRPLGEYSADQ